MNFANNSSKVEKTANFTVERLSSSRGVIGQINIPLIVRLQGTNAAEAKKLIDDSGLEVQSVILLQEAANKVAEAVS